MFKEGLHFATLVLKDFNVALLFQLLTRGNAKGNLRTTGTAKDSGTACSWLDRKRYLSNLNLKSELY